MKTAPTRTRHWARIALALVAAQFAIGLGIGTWLTFTGRADEFTSRLAGLL